LAASLDDNPAGDELAKGEVGILGEAVMNNLFTNKIFLVLLYDEKRYMAAVS
jgi:hypothetical protein